MFHACGLSNTGRVRKNNEDCYAIVPSLGLFVVADGMGGHNAGEVASRLAVDALVAFIQLTAETDDVTWPYGVDTALSGNGNRLKTAIQLANRRVFREAESHDDYTGMGTTIVAALGSPAHLVVGHVGDSRLYLFRGGRAVHVTRDDTWLATVLAGDTTSTNRIGHPMSNVLTSVLGPWEEVEVHVQEFAMTGGERVLLCSDGLHSVVTDEEISQAAGDGGDLEARVQRLAGMALERGGADNITVVLVDHEGGARG